VSPRPPSFLKLAGPGLVVAATGIGSGDVVSATVGGARYGVVLLWAIAIGAFFKFVLSEGIARWQLATGQTVVEGWAAHLPGWVKAYFAVYLVLWTVAVSAALTNATGLGITNLTGGLVPQSWGAVTHSIVGGVLVWVGGYAKFEKLMKLLVGVMGFSSNDTDAFRVEDLDTIRTLSPLISAGFEKAELFRKTLELSRVDELTGLLNYRVLMEKLAEEVRRKIRTGREFAFVMIDIDDFKRVNDRYGHLEGSRLIAQMGPLLRTACRTDSTDICFRYGGEEFCCLLPETSADAAETVAEHIRIHIEELENRFEINTIKVTISLGISGFITEDSPETLLKRADDALYQAKHSGRNRFVRL
jgi:diguanylate cyclase (GGDEF)-like protein